MSIYNPLWHYAIALYQRPGVEASCLALQEQGLSVNRLLLCCWLAHTGRRLEPDRLAEAEAWRVSVLEPLRAIRYQVRLMRDDANLEECYQQLKRAELAAEQVEMLRLWQGCELWAAAAEGQEPLVLARQNIGIYMAQLSRTSDSECLTGVQHLLGLAFPVSDCDDRPPEIDQSEL